MSTAILTLSENGELHRIHDKWLSKRAGSSQNYVESDQLQLQSFWGLFLIIGITCFLALLAYFIQLTCQFTRHFSDDISEPSRQRSSLSGRILTFLSFIDEKKEISKERLKRKRNDLMSNGFVKDDQPRIKRTQMDN